MASKNEFSGYLKQEVTVITTAQNAISYVVTEEGSGKDKVVNHAAQSDANNEVNGTVTEVGDHSMLITYTSRNRVYEVRVLFAQVIAIITSEMTEKGQELANAARERFSGKKPSGKKKAKK